MQELGGPNQANFETIVRSRLGPSEFMLFHEINHSHWLPIYGIKRRVLRLIFGNPIIAFTIMRDDLTAGLFAPVEILLVEGDDGNGCTVAHVLPSSLVAAANPRCCQPPVNSTGNSTPSSVARQALRDHRQPVRRRADAERGPAGGGHCHDATQLMDAWTLQGPSTTGRVGGPLGDRGRRRAPAATAAALMASMLARGCRPAEPEWWHRHLD